MPERKDIYDINRKRTGKIVERIGYEPKEGEYIIITNAVIMNSQNEILISKRAPHKTYPLMWEFNGGAVLAGENSQEAILRELKEELGLEFTKEEAILLKTIRRDVLPQDFKDVWLFKKDIKIEDITFPDGESIEAKFVTIDEFMEMLENKEIVHYVDFDREDYTKALKITINPGTNL